MRRFQLAFFDIFNANDSHNISFYILLSIYIYSTGIYTVSQKELITRGADDNTNQYYTKTEKTIQQKRFNI